MALLLLVVFLKPSLQFVSKPQKYWYFLPLTIVAYLCDLWIAHTSWRLIAGPLRPGEWTISQSLERLCMDYSHPYHSLFVGIGKAINHVDPDNKHISCLK